MRKPKNRSERVQWLKDKGIPVNGLVYYTDCQLKQYFESLYNLSTKKLNEIINILDYETAYTPKCLLCGEDVKVRYECGCKDNYPVFDKEDPDLPENE